MRRLEILYTILCIFYTMHGHRHIHSIIIIYLHAHFSQISFHTYPENAWSLYHMLTARREENSCCNITRLSLITDYWRIQCNKNLREKRKYIVMYASFISALLSFCHPFVHSLIFRMHSSTGNKPCQFITGHYEQTHTFTHSFTSNGNFCLLTSVHLGRETRRASIPHGCLENAWNCTETSSILSEGAVRWQPRALKKFPKRN